MRRPIRPFVTEYKSRSAKPASRGAAEDAAPEPTPRFLEPPAPAPRPREAEDSYEAAMRAADLVFGKKVVVTPLAPQPEIAPAPTAQPVLAAAAAALVAEFAPAEAPAPRPTGRILPSLIEAELEPPREPEPPPRKRGRPRKTAAVVPASEEAESPAAAPAPRKPRRAASAPAPRPIFAATEEPDLEIELDDDMAVDFAEDEEPTAQTPRRLSRIQARWVRRTELMAGERWKRRLPHPSRPR